MTIPLSRLDLYQCQYCQLLYAKKTELDQHMINEHNEENNKQRNTLNKQDLKRRTNYECVTCNKTFNYHNWHNHIRTVHCNDNLTCDQCNKSFKCHKYLYRHIHHVHLVKTQFKSFQEYICEQCSKAFKSVDCLNKHVRNCHSEKVTCQICKSVLKSAVYLGSHMRRVHCDSSKKSKCRICGKQFKSERQVRIHVGNTHEKKLCPRCGKMYSTTCLYYHVKKCNIGTQNAREDKIDHDDMNGDVIVDDNEHLDIASQISGNSNVHDDVKVDIRAPANDQLNNNNIGNFKRDINKSNNSQINVNSNVHDNYEVDIHDSVNDQLNINNIGNCKKDINKNDNNQINVNSNVHDDFKVNICDHDVHDDSEIKRGDWCDRANKIRRDDLSFYHYGHEINVTVDDDNVKGGTVHGVINNNINGLCNVQINNGDITRHFCKICNKKLKSEERVKIHMKNAHSKNLPVKCECCGKFFFNLKYFGVHVKKCRIKEVDVSPSRNENKFDIQFKIEIDNPSEINE
ncbi:putative uncharacterized protein DDB_G0286901 [Hyposmocoma kahamanoa]|uniref:putative uncharacterized protein DDB_G0286901 n=1 Tax=Hyposmocoma kahamanoa TaxID=1477025 RepID=UPI000E6D8F37|nr:putative uncharacterized protein DDB_G0286901 [Hyposmocoma kahamanoa]